jgi:hypothetical protein
MSLGIAVKGSEGLVLAADSRVSLQAQAPGGPSYLVTFDNATKLLAFNEPHNYIGAVTWGDAVIGKEVTDIRTVHSFLSEFEVGLPRDRMPVEEFALELSRFFLNQWRAKMPANHQTPGIVFVVAGYNQQEAYGRVYLFNIPNAPTPVEQSPGDFGITLGGQNEHVIRLLQGYDPKVIEIAKQTCRLSNPQVEALRHALGSLLMGIPYAVLPLQDCIDLAVFLIKMTVAAQNLSVVLRGVGGAIDVAVITQRDGLKPIQRKELVGQTSSL